MWTAWSGWAALYQDGVGRRLGHEHDERRQILVEAAEAIAGPGSQTGPACDLVAGLHVGNCRLVVDRLRVKAADEAQLILQSEHI